LARVTVNHTVEEYARALREARGLVSQAAANLGVSRQAVTQRMSKHPTLQQARDEAREGMIDDAESALYTAIAERESWAVLFYLKTQGRDRGYVERSEEHRAVTGDIRIRIEAVDDRGDPAVS
jgi:hypothetical protein